MSSSVSFRRSAPAPPAPAKGANGPEETVAAEVIVPGGGGGALNTFQRVMKLWTTLGPYNAVQVMTVAGTGDVARWDAAALETVQELGLGRPIFERNGAAVRYGRVAWEGVEQA